MYMYVIHIWHAQIYGNICLGMGVQARLPENSSEIVFCCCLFSPQLILQFSKSFAMVISKKTIISLGLRGGPTFFRGGGGAGSNFFQGGPNANFYRNPYNL